jgi:hypothetical protein
MEADAAPTPHAILAVGGGDCPYADPDVSARKSPTMKILGDHPQTQYEEGGIQKGQGTKVGRLKEEIGRCAYQDGEENIQECTSCSEKEDGQQAKDRGDENNLRHPF